MEASEFRNTWIDRMFEGAKSKAASLRKDLHYKALSKKLYTLLKYSEALRVNGAKHGDSRFKAVKAEMDANIEDFCDKFGVDKDHIYNKWPGLGTVSILSQEPKKPPLAIILVGGLCTVTVGLYILGVLAGIVTRGFHLIVH